MYGRHIFRITKAMRHILSSLLFSLGETESQNIVTAEFYISCRFGVSFNGRRRGERFALNTGISEIKRQVVFTKLKM